MHRERSTASSQEQKAPHASQVSLSIIPRLVCLQTFNTNTIIRPLHVVHHEYPEYPTFLPLTNLVYLQELAQCQKNVYSCPLQLTTLSTGTGAVS